MKKAQQIYALAVVVALLLSAAVFFLLVKPVQADQVTLSEQVEGAAAANAKLQSELADLKILDEGLAEQKKLGEELSKRLPQDVTQVDFFRQFPTYARESGVALSNITNGVPVAVPAPGGAPGAPAAPGAPKPAAASGPIAPAAPGDAFDGSDENLVNVPVRVEAGLARSLSAAPGTLYSSEATFAVNGTYGNTVKFLRALETSERAFLVVSVSMGPGPDNQLTTSVSGRFYVIGPKVSAGPRTPVAPAEPAS